MVRSPPRRSWSFSAQRFEPDQENEEPPKTSVGQQAGRKAIKRSFGRVDNDGAADVELVSLGDSVRSQAGSVNGSQHAYHQNGATGRPRLPPSSIPVKRTSSDDSWRRLRSLQILKVPRRSADETVHASATRDESAEAGDRARSRDRAVQNGFDPTLDGPTEASNGRTGRANDQAYMDAYFDADYEEGDDEQADMYAPRSAILSTPAAHPVRDRSVEVLVSDGAGYDDDQDQAAGDDVDFEEMSEVPAYGLMSRPSNPALPHAALDENDHQNGSYPEIELDLSLENNEAEGEYGEEGELGAGVVDGNPEEDLLDEAADEHDDDDDPAEFADDALDRYDHEHEFAPESEPELENEPDEEHYYEDDNDDGHADEDGHDEDNHGPEPELGADIEHEDGIREYDVYPDVVERDENYDEDEAAAADAFYEIPGELYDDDEASPAQDYPVPPVQPVAPRLATSTVDTQPPRARPSTSAVAATRVSAVSTGSARLPAEASPPVVQLPSRSASRAESRRSSNGNGPMPLKQLTRLITLSATHTAGNMAQSAIRTSLAGLSVRLAEEEVRLETARTELADADAALARAGTEYNECVRFANAVKAHMCALDHCLRDRFGDRESEPDEPMSPSTAAAAKHLPVLPVAFPRPLAAPLQDLVFHAAPALVTLAAGAELAQLPVQEAERRRRAKLSEVDAVDALVRQFRHEVKQLESEAAVCAAQLDALEDRLAEKEDDDLDDYDEGVSVDRYSHRR